jgi:hypothetical protein
LIWAQRLPAQKLGRDWFIEEKDLALVANRKPGRPPKDEEKAKSAKSSKRSPRPAKKSRKAKVGTNYAGAIEEKESTAEAIATKKAPASKPDPEADKSAKKRSSATRRYD